MGIERTLETQRLRLLRLVAGLVVLLGFLSLGPVSRGFSGAVCGFVGSVLSRAETAAQYLVIAQARLMAARSGSAVDRRQLLDSFAPSFAADNADVSLSECRARLKALRAALLDLPRYALRLIRRIERQMRGADCADQLSPRPTERPSASHRDWCLTGNRVERPPDKNASASPLILPPPEVRAGGAGR